MRKLMWVSCLCVASIALTACGQAAEDSQAPAEGTAKEAVAADAGIKLVDEILGVFDQCGADAATLATDRPEAAVLIPQLEELYESCGAKMTALNVRFLALRDQDIFRFREANGHMSDNRITHIDRVDGLLRPTYAYYNYEKGESVVFDMLSSQIVKLLDVAVKQ